MILIRLSRLEAVTEDLLVACNELGSSFFIIIQEYKYYKFKVLEAETTYENNVKLKTVDIYLSLSMQNSYELPFYGGYPTFTI